MGWFRSSRLPMPTRHRMAHHKHRGPVQDRVLPCQERQRVSTEERRYDKYNVAGGYLKECVETWTTKGYL